MPSPVHAWLARVCTALLLALATAWAAPAAAGAGPRTLVLGGPNDLQDGQPWGLMWIDAKGDSTIAQVAAVDAAGRFQPVQAQTTHTLGPTAVLWLHFRLARAPHERREWLIEFPMPVLDSVTVFQRDGNAWRSETAGDMHAVQTWPEAGRYPFFRVELPPGQVRDVYVRIRHTTGADFPVEFAASSAHGQRIQLDYLGLGLAFGSLFVLIASCLSQSWVYRDLAYAWYAAYASVTALAMAAFTGVAAHLLWPGFGALGDAPQGSLVYFSCAASLLLVRNVIGIPARNPMSDRVVQLLGLGGLLLGLLHPMLAKVPGVGLLSAYMLASVVINMVIALAAWRRGDPVGMWVFIGFAPVLLSLALAAARLFGLLQISFATQYAIVLALGLQVPLLLVALGIRSRERHGAQIREQALSTQDALTGLLAPHLFHDRLRQVVARYKREREHAAVVFIDLVNYPQIKSHYGSAVAEQSLLRSVIKLRRLLRDADTVSRIGEARFGVILEGAHSRVAVTDRGARLIAAGLMPLKGLKPEVTLQFHIASILLDERFMEAEELVQALSELLRGMSPRTRRPIRFIQPESTQPAGLGDSSLLGEALQDERNEGEKALAG